ncbi:hypothetical protein [Porphyromonas cangingivalis]|uniref:hypothetical protein n=1 Tax=Porphyromonas cangingivalis TaxID=36874 RepID=UPI0011DD818E|nr:hypothetical protein [Porphyromonas cangingivalis]
MTSTTPYSFRFADIEVLRYRVEASIACPWTRSSSSIISQKQPSQGETSSLPSITASTSPYVISWMLSSSMRKAPIIPSILPSVRMLTGFGLLPVCTTIMGKISLCPSARRLTLPMLSVDSR